MNELIQYLQNLWQNAIVPTIKRSLEKSKENTDRIVGAIENKRDATEISVNNLDEAVEPIVEAQNKTTDAIKAIPRVDIPETDFSSLERLITELKTVLENKKMDVNVGKTVIDIKSVVKAIEKLEKNLPKMEKQEVIDYTLMFDEMMKIMEKPHYSLDILKIQDILGRLATTDDMVAISEWLRVIAEKEGFKFNKEGRLKVEVDRAGGGTGGLTSAQATVLDSINTNTTGIAKEVKQDDIIDRLSLYVNDPMLTIAHGSNPLISDISWINKFGRNPDIDVATDPEDIWDGVGLWVPPTVPRVHNLSSTSANDAGTVLSTGTATGGNTTTLIDTGATFITDGVAVGDAVLDDTNIDHSIVLSVDSETQLTLEPTHHLLGFNVGDTYRVVTDASTGAYVIHIYGLNSDFVEQEEFVVMNGTNNVATAKTYWRIYRMHIDGSGDRTLNNIGIIKATAVTDATVTAQINIGNGQTGMAIYTVPAGKTAYLTNSYYSINRDGKASGALANVTLRQTKFAAYDGAGSIVEHFSSLAIDGSGHVQHFFKPYRRIRQRTDIFLRCDLVTDDNTSVSGGFDIILVNN